MMGWETEDLYFDGDQFYDAVLKEIDGAKDSVALETYIYDDDAVGRMIDEALIRSSKRGVRTRLVVDGIGASRWIETRAKHLESQGVEVRIFHPVWISSLFKRGRKFFSRVNRRDHRKLVIVDKTTAFVGSINISATHSKRVYGKEAWRDSAVRVTGSPISDLMIAFDHAWLRSHTPDGKRKWSDTLFPLSLRRRTLRPRSPFVLLNFTLRLRRKMYRELGEKIAKAQKRVWITNAYLAPSAKAVKSLGEAAKRGLDVRVLVPRKSDVFFMPWIATSHYTPLLKSKVRVYEYLPRFLHAKSVIIDDWPTVGTSNLNHRSLLYDFEVDIVLGKSESLKKLEEQYLLDLNESEELLEARGGIVVWIGRVLSLFFGKWI